jgi:hypothetical protein
MEHDTDRRRAAEHRDRLGESLGAHAQRRIALPDAFDAESSVGAGFGRWPGCAADFQRHRRSGNWRAGGVEDDADHGGVGLRRKRRRDGSSNHDRSDNERKHARHWGIVL